jgi:uncharacterized C2H2 Zn-finger protein
MGRGAPVPTKAARKAPPASAGQPAGVPVPPVPRDAALKLVREGDEYLDGLRSRLGFPKRPGSLAPPTVMPQEKDADGEFKCPKCKMVFKKKSLAQKHWQAKHLLQEERDTRFQCPHCQKRLLSRYNLDRHVAELHGEQKVCNTCQKKFGSKEALDRHELNVHQGRQDLECEYCEKVLANVQPSSLRTHMQYCKKNPNYKGPFPCPKGCGKKYQRSGEAKRHASSGKCPM